ncbi:MAG: hypothetical protein AW07_03000 [Candidatus Accumulibacter sp. SK-11]|nr:MAG: hypothetical protein AW07_03000 [Candidatus Accumulibacter sp. SK-11]
MCLPPGAISASPGSTRSLFRPSRTSIVHSELRRSANIAVNCSGMCWTMTIPAIVSGRRVSTASSACVPPVEVPMAITLSVVCSTGAVPADRITSARLTG